MTEPAGTTRREPGERDDASLVLAARAGDAAAFAALYRRHAPVVHGVLLSRVQKADADDLTQEVFSRCWAALRTLRDPGAIGAWLLTSARRCVIDLARTSRARAASAAAAQVTTHAAHPAAGSAAPLDAETVMNAIRRLPEAYRETLTLRLVEGLTGPEIAQRTGLTPGSVRVNLSRGMDLLRAALAEAAP